MIYDDDDEDGGWMTHADDSSDLWEPTDDVDVIEDETETRLHWRVVRPDGSVAADASGSDGFTSRTDALTALWNFVDVKTAKKLEALNHSVAGWCAIEADGWKIEPVK